MISQILRTVEWIGAISFMIFQLHDEPLQCCEPNVSIYLLILFQKNHMHTRWDTRNQHSFHGRHTIWRYDQIIFLFSSSSDNIPIKCTVCTQAHVSIHNLSNRSLCLLDPINVIPIWSIKLLSDFTQTDRNHMISVEIRNKINRHIKAVWFLSWVAQCTKTNRKKGAKGYLFLWMLEAKRSEYRISTSWLSLQAFNCSLLQLHNTV